MQTSRQFAALVMAALCGSAAQAATASFGITNLRYELVDLDPNDNVTPSLQLQTSYNYAGAFTWDRQEDWRYSAGEVDATWGTSVAHVASYPTNLSGSLVSEDQKLAAVALHYRYFSLTPNTAVTFHADAVVDAQGEFTQLGAPGSTWAQAKLELELTANRETVSYAIDETTTYRPLDQPAELLSVTVQSGAVPVRGELIVDGRGYSFMPAVPEPSSYAMLGVGLLALATLRKFSRPGTMAGA